jgi:hypothetical protein
MAAAALPRALRAGAGVRLRARQPAPLLGVLLSFQGRGFQGRGEVETPKLAGKSTLRGIAPIDGNGGSRHEV